MAALRLSSTFLLVGRCAARSGASQRTFVAILGAVPPEVVPSASRFQGTCPHYLRTLTPGASNVPALLQRGPWWSGRAVYSTAEGSPKKQSYTERIKVVLKEYGPVAVVFHTVIALFSLGTCYILVSSGLDVDAILHYFNVDSSGAKKGASTLAIAYVLHKFLLPLRATITIVSVPVIVRRLRARGWMRAPLKQAVSKLTDTVGKAK